MSARRKTTAAAIAFAALGLAGCGGNGDAGDEGAEMRGDSGAGREIFTARADPTCASCHTLADAGATMRNSPRRYNRREPQQGRIAARGNG
jgi:mono/diheme cytochrome c family protein